MIAENKSATLQENYENILG